MPIGAVIGSTLAGPAAKRFKEMHVVVVCWGVNALLNLLPLFWPGLWSLMGFLLGAGLFGVMGNVIGGSIRPRMVPGHLLGRVQGAARVVAFGAMPLGALVGGQIAELFGIPVVIAGVVVLMLASTAYVGTRVPQRLVDEHELREPAADEVAEEHAAA
ncbi:MFS transporter [Tessaracoccus sp. HDW20]|uniref:MFS transporter n=1 Tax=Tessaracoccus coleopterorum TaxID=2714950 RepID=UPI0018D36BDB|nr:MFS transporter [Tessaracoccus coleopterorum]NHB85888.1 MFS transporter [Tessaracoccus coleopterorum]